MIALKNSKLNYSRTAEAKIATLREVIQRVQNGEDVDVERMLGTGDPKQEKEWEGGTFSVTSLAVTSSLLMSRVVMQEIVAGDPLWQADQRKRAEKAQKKLDKSSSETDTTTQAGSGDHPAEARNLKSSRPGFY